MAVDPRKTEEILLAARAFIEKEGVEALTMRALGKQMGSDPSTVYRHFSDKASLLRAVGGALMSEIDLTEASKAPSVRDRLRIALLEMRRVMTENPASGVILAMSENIPSADSLAIVQWGVQQLREWGLTGNNLVIGYQLLEGYGLGLTAYDISSQPNPLEVRRQWFRSSAIPEFDHVSRDTTQIAAINDATFELGLDAILDKLEALTKTA